MPPAKNMRMNASAKERIGLYEIDAAYFMKNGYKF